MNLKMQVIRDENGHLRPDMDYRDVPLSVMAAYLAVNKATVWRRLLAGHYPEAGIRRMGSITYYRPRVICGAAS